MNELNGYLLFHLSRRSVGVKWLRGRILSGKECLFESAEFVIHRLLPTIQRSNIWSLGVNSGKCIATGFSSNEINSFMWYTVRN